MSDQLGMKRRATKRSGEPPSKKRRVQKSDAFRAVLSDYRILRDIVVGSQSVVSKANFDLSPDGISVMSQCDANVSFVEISLDKDMFDEYVCEVNQTLGIDLEALQKVLSCANAGDSVVISATEDADLLTVTLEGPGSRSTYALRILVITVEEDSEPFDWKKDVVIEMPSKRFRKICRDLAKFGEEMSIDASQSGAVAFSTTGELGDSTIEMEDVLDEVRVVVKNAVDQTFAIKFMLNFCKACALSPKVTISLTTGTPITVEFVLQDGSSFVRFYLMARTTDDDEMDADQFAPDDDEEE